MFLMRFFKTKSTHRDLSIAHVFMMLGPRIQVQSILLTHGLSENLIIFGNVIDFGRKSGISSVENVAKHHSNSQNTPETDSVTSVSLAWYLNQLTDITNTYSPCFTMCSAEVTVRV